MTATEVDRDVVRVSGPDAVAYLQGQLSQNVERLDVGATTWSFVLQPTGKVDVWCRVTRTADDTYILDVDGGAGEALVARLRRFLLRTKAEIEPLEDWRCMAVRGPGAVDAGRQPESDIGVDAEIDTDAEVTNAEGLAGLRVPAGWPGVEGTDLLGPLVEPPTGVASASREDYEALRIVSGVPAMGAELTDKTIPAEAGQWIIDASVDFTKGCFTGQELVARIDSRGGNVPRHLRGLVVAGAIVPPTGATVRVGDADVGTVTSSARSAAIGATVALAYVGRAVEPPTEATVTWDEGEAAASIQTLPLDAAS